jgi:hypothetical protein
MYRKPDVLEIVIFLLKTQGILIIFHGRIKPAMKYPFNEALPHADFGRGIKSGL